MFPNQNRAMSKVIEFFLYLILSGMIGAICGAFTRFFEYLIGNPFREEMSHGNIFSFYGRWIRLKYDAEEAKLNQQSSYRLNMWKALGVCPYCVNVYITGIFGGFCIWYSGIYWWLIFAVLAVSHYVLGYIFDKEGY